MRRIALINQKGGVGKTTTTVNLGAALALKGQRVVVFDLDPQGNLSLHLDQQLEPDAPGTYGILLGSDSVEQALRPTNTPGLQLVGANIDLSGAELELASQMGRESLLLDAIDAWERASIERTGAPPADFILFDCPPSLGLLSINGLVAARETIITLQTEFFALQGMSKLVEVVQLLRRRLNPQLTITGILPCLYDSRLRLAREVLAEIRNYFPDQVFQRPIARNIKLAEAPSYGQTIFEYAPDSPGAVDYVMLARELLERANGAADPAAPPAEIAEEAPPASEPLREAVVAPQPPPPAPRVPQGSTDVEDLGVVAHPARPPERLDPEQDVRRIVRAEDLPPVPREVFEPGGSELGGPDPRGPGSGS